MNIYMAAEAFRIFVMHCLTVRFPMAVGTLRNKAVFILVTGYAGQGVMLAGAFRQVGICLGMAGTAGI